VPAPFVQAIVGSEGGQEPRAPLGIVLQHHPISNVRSDQAIGGAFLALARKSSARRAVATCESSLTPGG
jgi:hypothetical protein